MHKHAKPILTILLASLLVLPSASATYWGYRGYATPLDPDDDSYAVASADCGAERSIGSGNAAGPGSHASADARGAGGSTEYRAHNTGDEVYRTAIYEGSGPTYADASSGTGTLSAVAHCEYLVSRDGWAWPESIRTSEGWEDTVGAVVVESLSVGCEAASDGDVSRFTGEVGWSDGALVLVGVRDGDAVVLPAERLGPTTAALAIAPGGVVPSGVPVEAYFSPGVCGVVVGA